MNALILPVVKRTNSFSLLAPIANKTYDFQTGVNILLSLSVSPNGNRFNSFLFRLSSGPSINTGGELVVSSAPPVFAAISASCTCLFLGGVTQNDLLPKREVYSVLRVNSPVANLTLEITAIVFGTDQNGTIKSHKTYFSKYTLNAVDQRTIVPTMAPTIGAPTGGNRNGSSSNSGSSTGGTTNATGTKSGGGGSRSASLAIGTFRAQTPWWSKALSGLVMALTYYA
jgi:hypothetical protein